MTNSLDDLFRFHQQALSLRSERQQVLASNIANADTPNYKARDFDFAAALRQATSGSASVSPSMKTTSAGHMNGTPSMERTTSGVELKYRTVRQGSVDGNSVDMDTERAQFTDNAIHYQTSLTVLSHEIRMMLAAIQG
ncbi:MAG: flagellar basal body rod protein FlgB [Hydrogenophilaceae bacterium]|jgi:flagellar basal-body rod protein FlgB|nr:flagellar basal body rod protein FlgB [Hydrogenophilaceae bacterium]